jgi:hypothetical protein
VIAAEEPILQVRACITAVKSVGRNMIDLK